MDMNMYVVAFVHAMPQVVHITPHGGVAHEYVCRGFCPRSATGGSHHSTRWRRS